MERGKLIFYLTQRREEKDPGVVGVEGLIKDRDENL